MRGLLYVALVLAGQMAAATESERFVSATIVDNLPNAHRFRAAPEVVVKETRRNASGSVKIYKTTDKELANKVPAHIRAEAVRAVAHAAGHPDLNAAVASVTAKREQAEFEAQMAEQAYLSAKLDLAAGEHGLKLTQQQERAQGEADSHRARQERAHAEINAEQAVHAVQIQAHHETMDAEHQAAIAAQEAAYTHIKADEKIAETVVHTRIEHLRDAFHNAQAQRESAEATETSDIAHLKAVQRELEEAKERLDQQKARLGQLSHLVSKRDGELNGKKSELLNKKEDVRKAQNAYDLMMLKLQEVKRIANERQALADQAKIAYEQANSNFKVHKTEREGEFASFRETIEGRLRTEVAELESSYTEQQQLLRKNMEDEQIALPRRIAEISDQETSALTQQKDAYDDRLKQIEEDARTSVTAIEQKQRSLTEARAVRLRDTTISEEDRQKYESKFNEQMSALSFEASEQRRMADEQRGAVTLEHNREVQKIKDQYDGERNRVRDHVTGLEEGTHKQLSEMKAEHDGKIDNMTRQAKNKVEAKRQQVDEKDNTEQQYVDRFKDQWTVAQQGADEARLNLESEQKLVDSENGRELAQKAMEVVEVDVEQRAANLVELRKQLGETERAVERNAESVRLLESRFKNAQMYVYRDEQQVVKTEEVEAAKQQAENAAEAQAEALRIAEDKLDGMDMQNTPVQTQEPVEIPDGTKVPDAIATAQHQQAAASSQLADAEVKLEYIAQNPSLQEPQPRDLFVSHEYTSTPGLSAAKELMSQTVADHNDATVHMLPTMIPTLPPTPAPTPEPTPETLSPEQVEIVQSAAQVANEAKLAAENANTVEEAEAAQNLAQRAAEISEKASHSGADVASLSEAIKSAIADAQILSDEEHRHFEFTETGDMNQEVAMEEADEAAEAAEGQAPQDEAQAEPVEGDDSAAGESPVALLENGARLKNKMRRLVSRRS